MGRWIRAMGAAARAAKIGGKVAITAATVVPAVKQNTKDISSMKRRIKRPERKYFDTNTINQTPDVNAQTATNMTLIAAGTGVTNRIGSEVNIESIDFGYKVNQIMGHTGPCAVRVILFQDKTKDSVSSAPTSTEIVESTGIGNPGDYVFAPYDKGFPTRFKILHDRVHKLGVLTTTAASGNSVAVFRRRIKIPKANSRVWWDETGNAQADLRGGVIYAIALSDSPDDSFAPNVDYHTRLNFYDN